MSDPTRTRAEAKQRAKHAKLYAAYAALDKSKPGTHEHAAHLHRIAERYEELGEYRGCCLYVDGSYDAQADWAQTRAWFATAIFWPDLDFHGNHDDAIHAHEEQAFIEKHGQAAVDEANEPYISRAQRRRES